MPERTDVRRRLALTLAGFGALTLVVCLLAPLAGSTSISLSRVFDRSIPFADNVDAQVFFVARLPRVVAAAVVGAGLALSGVVFQALLRNPLASPDTLGVAAGATLGAMLALTAHADFTFLGISVVPLTSFLGSIGSLAIVMAISLARRRGTSSTVLLLAGIAVGALLNAAGRFIQYLANVTDTFRTVQWLMGSLDVGSYAPIVASLVPFGIACAGFVMLPRVLDLISLGDDAAEARGWTSSGWNASRWSARRCPPARPCRSAGRCSSWASSSRTSSVSSSARITGSCCRRRRSSARRSSSPATSSRGRSSRRSKCLLE